MRHASLLAIGFAILVSVPAHAAAAVTSAGPRVGFSVDPDQIVFGGHLEIGEVAPKITFDPNLDLGFGDNLTTVGINFDLHYHLALKDSDWRPYLGAGLGINFNEIDQPPPYKDISDNGVGGTLLLGAQVPTRSGQHFFGEMKFGLGSQIASLKLLVGWNFKM